jgi:hypothetical protein
MSADYVCLYVDNSNIFIEGQRIAETVIGEDGHSFRIYFKNFIDLATSGRELREVVWGGSIPPQNDSLWKHLRGIGVKPDLIPRSASGENGTVDSWIQLKMHRHARKYQDQPGTMVVATGDGKGYDAEDGFLYDLEGFLERGWRIEVMSWGHCCHKKLKEFAERHGRFVALDAYYRQITFIKDVRVVEKLTVG